MATKKKPQTGRKAPDFTLPATGDKKINLRSLRGENVVLYFYPRDNTPGCTTEGQDFKALHRRFRRQKTLILGVSRDSLRAHEKFRDKFGFPFDLLSDEDGKVCEAYDVIKANNMYGKQAIGIERSTFLIDASGTLTQEWRKVRVKGHAEEVLEAAKQL